MVWQRIKNIAAAVGDWMKSRVAPQMYMAERQAENTALTIAANTALAERRDEIQAVMEKRRQEMQLAQLKIQYVQQVESREFQALQAQQSHERARELQDKSQIFQAEMAKLSHERAKEMQAFIQLAENARLEKNLDFQRWRLEQEKAFQLQLLELNHQLQRELAGYQRQSSLKVVEEQKRLENSPIWLVATDILNSYPVDEIMPLRIFFAPPKVQFEKFANAANAAKGFPDIELTLAEGLRQFFRNYSTQGRHLDFLAGAWVSKSFHSEASIKALFGVLKSEPTLVLESEVDGDYLNFRIAYWSLNWSKYRYDPVVSRLPYRDILYEAAKNRARKWPETRAKLIAAGVSAEEVDKLYGQDNIKNLEIWQKEEKFKQAGINSEELELNYIVNKKDFEELCQFLIISHCLFAGLVTDEYFLLEYNLPPLLPQLLPGLTQNVPDTEAIQAMIKAVVLYYQNMYHTLESQRSGWVPELALDLAQSLAHLPNKSWAKGRIIYSLKCWLKLRELPQPDRFEPLLQAVESVLTIADLAYVVKLNECLTAAGESCFLSVKDACYKRGMSRCQQEDYSAAILDFDQAIQINPNWGEVFYNRAFAYGKLGQFQKAIDDYTQALQINPKWTNSYIYRGNFYYQLGNHEQAIADYNLALSINPNLAEAAKNRDIVQGVWDEIKRKEEERKRSLENFELALTISGHSNIVRSLAISPDGQTLVSGSNDKTIKIWQLSSGQELLRITGLSGYVYALAISPDGQMLVCGFDNNIIKIYQLSSGQEIYTLTGHSSSVYSLAISPDGQMLVSASSDNTIKIWQLSTGKELRTLTGHFSYVFSLAISPDGQTLVSGSGDNTIKIWQLSSGQEICTLTGHSSSVYALAISPDGQTLASGSNDNTIKIWQLSSRQELRTLIGHSYFIHSLAISPDGQRLVSGSGDRTIKIWQLSTGQELRTFTGHSSYVYCVGISPNGQTLFSSSEDRTVKIWRVA